MTLSSEDRHAAEGLMILLAAELGGGDNKARLAIVAQMLLAYPMPNASERTGKARAEAYLDALGDIPPFAIVEAVKLWNRGEAGDHDYTWAPAPAVLRKVCQKIIEPLRQAVEELEALVGALTLEEAMNPAPIESKSGLRVIK